MNPTPKKILIVDDEEYVVDMIKLRLEEEGYEIQSAPDGSVAIKTAESFQPDLIIMDLMMEGLTGTETIKILKANKNTSIIPVLVLTGKVSEEDKKEVLSAGAKDFITKPILPARLLFQIKKMLPSDGE
ncbi:MAG: response regulator [Candidatus Aureabacteria bacterium]|nr:response regulator [Candidatus Auribacterota bacterium]